VSLQKSGALLNSSSSAICVSLAGKSKTPPDFLDSPAEIGQRRSQLFAHIKAILQ